MLTQIQTNKLLDVATPWKLVKDTASPESKLLLQRTIFLASESLRLVGIFLQPFMPEKAAQLLDILGVSEDRRTLQHARPFADFDYGTSLVPLDKKTQETLFPRLLEN
jgi:methionyl-tRNA synthetase